MPAVSRLGDLCTGHGCFPSRPSISASGNVFAQGLAVQRVGDAWASHGCATCAPHGGALAAGSSKVFVNGKPMARIGDPVDCGSLVATGSSKVFAGG
jgi:uncharacterized Zn-binding protein involved in type VI secretion